MLYQENRQADQQASALSTHFEELLRKQTNVQIRYEVLLNQRALLLEQQRALLALRKELREQSQQRNRWREP
jgi:hypothetical protein